MIELKAQELPQISGGSLVTHTLKCTQVFTRTYTLLANILEQENMNLSEATQYYAHLGHSLGEFLYNALHPETLCLYEHDA